MDRMNDQMLSQRFKIHRKHLNLKNSTLELITFIKVINSLIEVADYFI